MMRRHTRMPPLLALLLAAAACAPAVRAPDATTIAAVQAPPASDIYLVEVAWQNSVLRISAPVNVSNRSGYDNQPSFTPDGGAVLYTSIRADGQADIYRYDLTRRETTRVTRTAESEYSPTVTPDGSGISVVRVEADSTQRLWRFDLDGSSPRLVLEEIRPVGYHAWVDDHMLALFVLGSPPTLQLADTRTGRAEVVAQSIGRSLHRIPGRRAISFVEKPSEEEWWISELDPAARQVTRLTRTPAGAEDHAWMPDGTVLMGQGSRLYAWRAGQEGGWREVADLAGAGLHNLTRLAVSPTGDRLAIVADAR